MELLQAFLGRSVGPLTVVQWLIAIAVVWVAITVLQRLAKAAGGGDGKNTVPMRCHGCGWRGDVSRYHRTCPKCGDHITQTRSSIPSV